MTTILVSPTDSSYSFASNRSEVSIREADTQNFFARIHGEFADMEARLDGPRVSGTRVYGD